MCLTVTEKRLHQGLVRCIGVGKGRFLVASKYRPFGEKVKGKL